MYHSHTHVGARASERAIRRSLPVVGLIHTRFGSIARDDREKRSCVFDTMKIDLCDIYEGNAEQETLLSVTSSRAFPATPNNYPRTRRFLGKSRWIVRKNRAIEDLMSRADYAMTYGRITGRGRLMARRFSKDPRN